MSLESSAGELDVQTKSGKIVESKSTFGYNEQNIDAELRKKLTAMRDDPRVSFDGNTLRVIATKVEDRNMVKTKIKNGKTKSSPSPSGITLISRSKWLTKELKLQSKIKIRDNLCKITIRFGRDIFSRVSQL